MRTNGASRKDEPFGDFICRQLFPEQLQHFPFSNSQPRSGVSKRHAPPSRLGSAHGVEDACSDIAWERGLSVLDIEQGERQAVEVHVLEEVSVDAATQCVEQFLVRAAFAD